MRKLSLDEIQNGMNLFTDKKRFYSTDSLSGQLEEELLKHDISQIGDAKWCESLIIQVGQNKGDQRSASLEMNRSFRAYRSKDIKELSQEGLILLHDYEQKRMTRFASGISEIRDIIGTPAKGKSGQVFLTPGDLAILEEEVKKCQPPMTRLNTIPGFETWDQWLIPYYFVYDNTFDGMNYHHAIDWNVWKLNKNG